MVPGLLLFHEDAVVAEGINNQFRSCALAKRGCVPGTVEATPRQQFIDYSKPLGLGDTTVYDETKTMRQWHGGLDVYKKLIRAMVEKTGLKANDAVVLEHMTAYDPSAAQSCLELNCSETRQQEDRPYIHYVGAFWSLGSSLDCSVATENCKDSVEAAGKNMIRQGKHPLVKAEDFSDGGGALLTSAGTSALVPPVLDTTKFKQMYPSTETNELMFQEETVAKGEALGRVSVEDPRTPGKQINFEELRSELEQAHNPSGRTWDPTSRKRAAEGQGGSRRDAISLPEATPEQEKSSKAFVPGNESVTLKVSSDGLLLMAVPGGTDVVETAELLFTCMGHFSKTEAEAKMEMKKKNAYYFEFALTADSEVYCDQKEAPENDNTWKDLEIPDGRMPMKKLLAHLGSQGEAGFKLPCHEIKLESDGTWSVKNTETSCYVLDYKKPAASAENLNDKEFPQAVDVKKLCSAEVYPFLYYDSAAKKFSPWNPAVGLVKPAKVEENKMYNLSAAAK